MRTIFFFVTKHEFGNSLRQFGFAYAGWAKEQQHAVRFVVRLLQWAFVQAQPLGDCFDRAFCPITRCASIASVMANRSLGVAENHVAWNARLLRDHSITCSGLRPWFAAH
jgi:hypothetical protein